MRKVLQMLGIKSLVCAAILALTVGCTVDESGPISHGSGGKGGSISVASNGGGTSATAVGGATQGTAGTFVGIGGAAPGPVGDLAGGAGEEAIDAAAMPVDEPPPAVCSPTTPADPLIADFHNTGQTTGISFGDFAGGFSGYSYQYGAGLMSDVTMGVWHLAGMVTEYSGFGLGFNFDNGHNVDASSYSGVTFTIKGNVGPSNTLTLGVQNGPDSSSTSTFSSCATCAAGCGDPNKVFTVVPGGATISLKWSDFTGGQPHPGVDPKQLLGLIWFFGWTGQGSTPYAVDVTIDDVKFTVGGGGDAAPE